MNGVMEIKMMELNKVYRMDYMKGMKELPNKSIDLVATDPPYQFNISTVKNSNGGGFYKHQKKKYIQEIEDSFGLEFNPIELLNEIKRVCKKFNTYIWTNKHLLREYIEFALKYNFHWELLIWQKPNPVPIFNDHYLFDKEFCIYIAEKGRFFNSNHKYDNYRTVMSYPVGGGTKETNHPTEKPLFFIKNQIRISSQENDLVLDPFMGSGTTAVACKQLNRNFIGKQETLSKFLKC